MPPHTSEFACGAAHYALGRQDGSATPTTAVWSTPFPRSSFEQATGSAEKTAQPRAQSPSENGKRLQFGRLCRPPSVCCHAYRPSRELVNHDFHAEELELHSNTELTRQIYLLTEELHRRVVGDSERGGTGSADE